MMGWIKATDELPAIGKEVHWKWIGPDLINRGVFTPLQTSNEFHDYFVWDGNGSYFDPLTTKECYWMLEENEENIL